ncbi:hypothetical protein LTR84_009727 [Exophiala bonariae]|uniref:NmrA-like domain-containing protein n=1 Tax=Exophiala bonariae TaxID=1690606 RepID=A0AAV9NK33_9EURO|nr:hypothetical protein LTR84_009727 [Exophiala bonariae]
MPGFQKILLVGATGTFGGLVAVALSKRRQLLSRLAVYHNTARKTDEAKKLKIAKFEALGIEIVSANGYASPEPFGGFDCVMIFSGNYGLQEQPQIIDSAIAAGVRHFYPSEYGADLLAGDNWNQRYYRYKALTRNHLEMKGKEYADLGWTYFLVGRLTEWAVISHFGIDNKHSTARIYGTESGRQSLIGVQDAIAYLVETLNDSKSEHTAESDQTDSKRRTYRISGSSPSYQEIFVAMERITGRKYAVTYLDVESALIEESDAKARGDIDGELAASHKLVQGRQGTLLPEPWDNARFPSLHTESFEDSLRAAFNSPIWRKAYGLD